MESKSPEGICGICGLEGELLSIQNHFMSEHITTENTVNKNNEMSEAIDVPLEPTGTTGI